MKLGILGTGHVAALGGAWGKTYDVTLGSREPVGKDVGFPVQSLADTLAAADVAVNAILGSVAVGGSFRHRCTMPALLPRSR
jgi:hypothetical protein